jgi:hypothetical protein
MWFGSRSAIDPGRQLTRWWGWSLTEPRLLWSDSPVMMVIIRIINSAVGSQSQPVTTESEAGGGHKNHRPRCDFAQSPTSVRRAPVPRGAVPPMDRQPVRAPAGRASGSASRWSAGPHDVRPGTQASCAHVGVTAHDDHLRSAHDAVTGHSGGASGTGHAGWGGRTTSRQTASLATGAGNRAWQVDRGEETFPPCQHALSLVRQIAAKTECGRTRLQVPKWRDSLA